jgi:dipeptidyl aminopeptidase/acylaminoacyl peptidase
VVEPTVNNPVKLASVGPWLLIETDQGLWAANADGSGLTQLTDVDYWDWHLQKAIQPGGNKVVLLSPSSFNDYHQMMLNLLSLPDGNIIKITDLTSLETEAYADLTKEDPLFEGILKVHSRSNYAWSPDGTRLAFVGLMDGPTAEIYLYDTISGEIQRVSTDDAQNYWPSWSPDGNSLLYFATQGVWSARGDGTNVTMLYIPESGGVEELEGWLDAKTAVLDTWTSFTGRGKLRLFDITTTKTVMLSEDSNLIAEADGELGVVMFADTSGLYLLTAEDRTLVRVSQEEVKDIDQVDPGEYFFSVYFNNGSLATFGISEMDHQDSPIEVNSDNLEVAMYAWIWGWASEDDNQPGVWITGPGIEIGQIFDGKARLPIWDEDNNLLFFAPVDGNGYDLYRTTFDAYFRDLAAVGFIDADVHVVTWLGGQ